MAWKVTCVMDEKQQFISDVIAGEYTMTELCRYYGISRKTGYKWWGRYQAEGPSGLEERYRAPHHHRHGISGQVEERILAIRGAHPRWGPNKILVKLRRTYPRVKSWPAASSIGALLKRRGLVRQRKRRVHSSPSPQPLTETTEVNRVWGADFKGHFRTGDGSRCNPLTITDNYSRFILCCQHTPRGTIGLVKPMFEAVFRDYGLPEVIRTDNGFPFGSKGLCGLTKLSVWWLRLGIYPERIEPGKPQQNGRHERMHLTLKQETVDPPARNLGQQQQRFDRFRIEFNEERPHESLGMRCPLEVYQESPREFTGRLQPLEYCSSMTVRKVQKNGEIYIGGRKIFISESLRGEFIGLEEMPGDQSRIWFCQHQLGTLDHKTLKVTSGRGPEVKRE